MSEEYKHEVPQKLKCDICDICGIESYNIKRCATCRRKLCQNHRIYLREEWEHICYGNQGCKEYEENK